MKGPRWAMGISCLGLKRELRAENLRSSKLSLLDLISASKPEILASERKECFLREPGIYLKEFTQGHCSSVS